MGGVTVVKVGGEVPPEPVCADLGEVLPQAVITHGGAPQIAELARGMGVRPRTLRSPGGLTSRHTDPAMLDVVTLALTGRAKPRLLRALAAAGVAAVGLTGLDGGLLRARRKAALRTVTDDGRTVVVRDDHSGRLTGVAPRVLNTLLEGGFVPVVSPPAAGEDGAPVNVDADRAAAAVAAAVGAKRLILLMSRPGVLRDAGDPASVLPAVALPRAGRMPYAATGGMHRKLIAARDALMGGVPEVIISDGRADRPVSAALDGAGTTLELA
ncbi:MAG: [LysW]-aminoadipate kinase [Streptosporangiales bacterium]|nr:[LysW]-aminoadipate kinase [Streptosporangiales bacterium]